MFDNFVLFKEALDIVMAADSKVRNNIFAIIDTESEEGIQQVLLFTPKLTFGWWYYTIHGNIQCLFKRTIVSLMFDNFVLFSGCPFQRF
jgi:hypothetical protein